MYVLKFITTKSIPNKNRPEHRNFRKSQFGEVPSPRWCIFTITRSLWNFRRGCFFPAAMAAKNHVFRWWWDVRDKDLAGSKGKGGRFMCDFFGGVMAAVMWHKHHVLVWIIRWWGFGYVTYVGFAILHLVGTRFEEHSTKCNGVQTQIGSLW